MWKRLERCLRWQPPFKPAPWYTLSRGTQRIFQAATSTQAFNWPQWTLQWQPTPTDTNGDLVFLYC
jgi:hypothetical protein